MGFSLPLASFGPSSYANSSIGLVAAPYGRRARTRGIVKVTNAESSLSRKLRHPMYSWEAKVFFRSRGLLSSRKSDRPNIFALAAVKNGANDAAAIPDMLVRHSMSWGWLENS